MAVYSANAKQVKIYVDLGRFPGAAHALLRDIRAALRDGKPIDGQACEYLVDAIDNILLGFDANRALYLKAPKGRQRGSDTKSAHIYWRVKALQRSGKTLMAAYQKVAVEEYKRGHTITDKGIERIFREFQKQIDKAVEMVDRLCK